MPVFATGSPNYDDEGGSGFVNLVHATWYNGLRVEIPVVVSNHRNGSVSRLAKELGLRFLYMSPPYDAAHYERLFRILRADKIAYSGWMKIVHGGNSRRDFNIHPGPLPLTQGLYGEALFRKILAEHRAGRIRESEVVMHFMTDILDDLAGIFFRCPVPIKRGDTWKKLQARTKKIEHKFQPLIAGLVLDGRISWDGSTAASMVGKIDLVKVAHAAAGGA